MDTKIICRGKEVIIGVKYPTVLIGERINPTGKKELAESLKRGELDLVRKEALAQVDAGADILDVNVGTGGVDETDLLPKAVMSILDLVDIPLCIDSAKPKAIASALEIYPGKALINSVSGEERSLNTILPLAKAYGAAVIGLALDEKGISKDPDKRLSIACKIVEKAESLGIPRADIIIDCLLLPVATDKEEGLRTLQTMRKVREALGVNITLGASNISFGFPDRGVINGAFLAMAIAEGLTCPIVDVAKARPAILAADLVLGRDEYGTRFLSYYRRKKAGNS